MLANQTLLAQSHPFKQAQVVAVAQERKRPGREVHDSVNQVLQGIQLGTNTVKRLAQRF